MRLRALAPFLPFRCSPVSFNKIVNLLTGLNLNEYLDIRFDILDRRVHVNQIVDQLERSLHRHRSLVDHLLENAA